MKLSGKHARLKQLIDFSNDKNNKSAFFVKSAILDVNKLNFSF